MIMANESDDWNRRCGLKSEKVPRGSDVRVEWRVTNWTFTLETGVCVLYETKRHQTPILNQNNLNLVRQDKTLSQRIFFFSIPSYFKASAAQLYCLYWLTVEKRMEKRRKEKEC